MKLNIFYFDENLKSYTYPILKILICLILIIVFINRGQIIHIDNKVVNVIIGVLCTTVGIICIYCIYISVFELTQVHENRAKTNVVLDSTIISSKEYSVDEIVSMAKNNDIIDIQIVAKDKAIEIGSSSDCKAGSSKFFDKLYYVDKNEFADINDFKTSLLSHTVNEKIMVISIDGIRPE